MTAAKTEKSNTAIEPFNRYTPAEVAQKKKARDERRLAIRGQNNRSKSLK